MLVVMMDAWTVGRPKLVYIAGYGRSGSTLLSIMLGLHKDIFGTGELTTLARHVWANNEYCSCGSPIRECVYWGPVGAAWCEEQRTTLLSDYSKLQDRFETIFSLSRVLRRTLCKSEFGEYSRHTVRLLETILSKSNRPLIVDSSKLPGRAAALAGVPGLDLYVIHLVRDGRGVAWSLLKSYQRDEKIGLQKEIKPKSVFRTAFRWAIVNLATEVLALRLGPGHFIRVRYEDLTSDPHGTLTRIGNLIGVELGGLGYDIDKGMSLQPEHQMAGNRLRMNATIEVSPDVKWKAQMPRRTRALFTSLCACLLRRYGYL